MQSYIGQSDFLKSFSLLFLRASQSTDSATGESASQNSGDTTPTSHNSGDLKRHHDGEPKAARLARPRIPKSDFRRNFANMWVNIFNSCDKELMMQHIDTYYEKDVIVRQRDVREGDIFSQL